MEHLDQDPSKDALGDACGPGQTGLRSETDTASPSPNVPIAPHEAIHHWFELSYAQYLTIPRSVLQSMSDEWQHRFVTCLEELDEAIDWRPKEGRYWVKLKDSAGRYVFDPLADYDRGRRHIPRVSDVQGERSEVGTTEAKRTPERSDGEAGTPKEEQE